MIKIRLSRLLSVGILTGMIITGWVGSVLGAQAGIGDQLRPPVLTAPAAPSDLKVSNFPGVLPVSLVWKDNSTNETGFTIERSANGGTYFEIATVAAGVTTYLDSTVSNDMLCRYRVCATGAVLKSGYSNEVQWVTLPNNPSNLVGNLDLIEGDIDLDWNGNNGNCAYQIQKTTRTDNADTKIELINLLANTNHYKDTNVQPDHTYTYFVMALSQAGRTDGSNSVTINYLAPPSNVMVYYFPGSTKLSVKWQNNTKNVTKFVVEKAYSNQGPIYSYDVPANSTEFVDDVVTDYFYMYRIKAVGPNGEQSPYSAVCYWYAPPRIPDGFQAVAVSSSEVKLTWNDRSEHETSFKIWRWGDNMVAPIDVAANTTTYSDKGLKANTSYQYSIKAMNDTSKTESEEYPKVSVTTQALTKLGDITKTPGGLILSGIKFDTVLQIGSPSMTVNGVLQEIDPGRGTAPIVEEGRTLVPIGAIIAAYGGTVAWDGTANKVTVACNGQVIELWVDSTQTKVNGVSKTTSVAPRVINDRTMLPLAFISENLGLKVSWDEAAQQVTIKVGS